MRALAIAVVLVGLCTARADAQEAETETARVLEPGVVEAGAGFELHRSSLLLS